MVKYTKIVFAMLIAFVTSTTAEAKSMLTIFFPGYVNTTYTLTINGDKIGGMDFPIKKVDDTLKDSQPAVYYHKAYKQLHFNKDGKFLVIIKMEYTNPNNGNVTTYQAEYLAVLEDGDEAFIEIRPKGLTDMKIKEIDSKSVSKYRAGGKYQKLPDSQYPVK